MHKTASFHWSKYSAKEGLRQATIRCAEVWRLLNRRLRGMLGIGFADGGTEVFAKIMISLVPPGEMQTPQGEQPQVVRLGQALAGGARPRRI